jgi:hypothetical protein
MKPVLASLLLCTTVLLQGCDQKTPGDALASKTVRVYAERDLHDGLVIEDFKRQNGWEDTSQINTYNVRYSYNLKLSKSMAEATLGLAKEAVAEINASKKNPGFMGINQLQVSMGLSLAASEWINAQEGFAARRDAFLSDCRACIDFWNQEGEPDMVKARRNAFVYAWSEMEKLGFKDAAKVGDKVPREAWAAFMKTEKGWMAKG